MLIPRSCTLQTKFICALTLASLLIASFLGAGFYFHMTNIYEDEVYEKAQLVLSQVDAVQQFVQGTLRPRRYRALPDRFIKQK